jgi:hypothetical protein
MKKEKEVGHIFSSNLLSLISRVGAGDSTAEDDLIHYTWPIIRRIATKWFEGAAGVDQRDARRDAIQEIQIHILEKFRHPKTKFKIDHPGAYIESVAKNFLRNLYAKEMVHFRKEGFVRSFNEEIEVEEDAPGMGSIGTFPRKDAAGRGTVTIERLYKKLPEDLRDGIEKSLDLVADLFGLRDNIRLDRTRNKRILKDIGTILEARKLVSRIQGAEPSDRNLQRLFEIRELSGPIVFDGMPETDRRVDARLAEERELVKKCWAAYSLWEVQKELESELRKTPGLNELIPGPEPWSGHFAEISKMRVSPLSVIYKVWSRAPGFRTGKTLKYRSRKRIALAFHYHKRASKGTPREVLFRNIKAEPIEGMEKSIEQFRKAGYGQSFQTKYAPIIKLISHLSFNEKN